MQPFSFGYRVVPNKIPILFPCAKILAVEFMPIVANISPVNKIQKNVKEQSNRFAIILRSTHFSCCFQCVYLYVSCP